MSSRSLRPSHRYREEDNPFLLPAVTTAVYVVSLALTGLVLWVLSSLWGDHIHMTLDELLGDGFVAEGLSRVWFIFAWGALATIAIRLLSGRGHTSSRTRQVAQGWWISLNAGVFEELIYRWMVFFNAMVFLTFFNWITFGLVKWFYGELLVPVANFFTFHALEAYLYDPRSWLVGAALVSASVKFRDAHHEEDLPWFLNLFRKVNAWFGGMVMFWLMLNFGLLTAIVAHVLYDAIVFTIGAIMREED